MVTTPGPGSSGNHLYAVDAVSPTDVWAVGQRLGAKAPDQGLVEHWNGKGWAVVNAPASTSASVLFDAVTVRGGQVWAAGEADSPGGGRAIITGRMGGRWQTAHLPASAGSNWTDLYGLATAGGSAWAVGTFVDPKSDNNETLILRGTGNRWTVDPGPNPGTSGSNILGGITAIDGQLWATGTYDNGGSRLPLAEHR